MTKIVLPPGGYSEHKVPKKADTFTFVTDGTCNLKGFKFTKNDGDFNQHSGGEAYDYDGLDIPPTGAEFSYSTDAPIRGNGTGVVKN